MPAAWSGSHEFAKFRLEPVTTAATLSAIICWAQSLLLPGSPFVTNTAVAVRRLLRCSIGPPLQPYSEFIESHSTFCGPERKGGPGKEGRGVDRRTARTRHPRPRAHRTVGLRARGLAGRPRAARRGGGGRPRRAPRGGRDVRGDHRLAARTPAA